MKKSIALSLIAFCATLAHGQGAPTFASYPANVEKATATAVKLSADQLKLLRSNRDGREFNSSLNKKAKTIQPILKLLAQRGLKLYFLPPRCP